MAYEYIFDIDFPFIDDLLVLNLTTNKYMLEFFYYQKLLDKQKEQNEITEEIYDFELKKLKEKYSNTFANELNKKYLIIALKLVKKRRWLIVFTFSIL